METIREDHLFNSEIFGFFQFEYNVAWEFILVFGDIDARANAG